MALLASGHAALETVSQIEIADFVEDCDNLLLLGVGDFHSHAVVMPLFMWSGVLSPDFRRNVVGRVGDVGAGRFWSIRAVCCRDI